jgi:cytoskeletal protein CcmA (bactofilin family)
MTKLLTHSSKWLIILSIVFLLVLTFVQPVQASVFIPDGRIDSDEVIDDDVFISGGEVIVDGSVNGILFAAGNTIRINGTINGDVIVAGYRILISEDAEINGNLFAAGYEIVQSGTVTGSSAVAGGALILNGEIQRNLYISGYHFEMRPQSQVGVDIFGSVYQSLLSGEISRDLGLTAAAVELYGTIGGDASIRVGAPTRVPFIRPFLLGDLPQPIVAGLRIFPEAELEGSLTYTSPIQQERTIESVPAGGIIFQTPIPGVQPEIEDWQPFGPVVVVAPFLHWIVNIFRQLVTLLFIGGLALWLAPRIMQRVSTELRTHPGPSAGYGVLSLFAGYITLLFLFVIVLLIGIFLWAVALGGLTRTLYTIGFSSIALVGAFFTFLAFQFSRVIVSYVLGEWAMRYIAPRARHRQVYALIAGVLIYVFLRSIPILGWILALAATFFALGAMWLAYRRRRIGGTPPAA